MPTINRAAYSVCNQLTTVLGQQFDYDVNNYPYPTTYDDIANVGDIYAFIKGPVLEQTIFTSDGLTKQNTKFYKGESYDMRGLASENSWVLTGDLRVRQIRTRLIGTCPAAPANQTFTTAGDTWPRNCIPSPNLISLSVLPAQAVNK